MRAGQQFAGRADGIDRIAFARAALAQVTAGVDLADLLARAGQVAGQAQPVMPGSFHRPHSPALSHGRSGPGQQLRVTRRGGGHLQLRHRPRRADHPPRDINDRGQNVGASLPSLTGTVSGFVLDKRRFTVIRRPSAVATALLGINNRGQIVGIGPAAKDLASLPGRHNAPAWGWTLAPAFPR